MTSYKELTSLASGYANQHILSHSPSPEIGRVVAGRSSGLKYLGLHVWVYLTFALVRVAAAGLLVVI